MGSGGGDRGHGKSGHNKGGRARGKVNGGYKNGSRSGQHSRSSTYMTADRARAIQSHADKNDRNADFKGRAMSAADRHDENGYLDEKTE